MMRKNVEAGKAGKLLPGGGSQIWIGRGCADFRFFSHPQIVGKIDQLPAK